MTEEKGILDEIEELVSDFKKKKPDLSPLDFVKSNYNIERQIAPSVDFKRWYRERYIQEHPQEPEYNKKVSGYCECGTKSIIYINQNEGLVEYMRTVREPNSFANCYEKRFFCIKCGKMSYVRMDSDFEIVSIKHEENLKI